jgi:hypothetical protein
MIKHGGSIQKDLKNRDGQWERPDEKGDGYLDPHGKDNFNRVETDSGGHIIVHV